MDRRTAIRVVPSEPWTAPRMSYRFTPDALKAPAMPTTFDYAGEGPEIGQVYQYRFSGFVVHEPETAAKRIRRAGARAVALAEAMFAGLPSRAAATVTNVTERAAGRQRRQLTRVLRQRLQTRYRFQTFATALRSHLQFPRPATLWRQLRDFPLTVQAVSLCCCFMIVTYFHLGDHTNEAANRQTAEAAAELRLTTGSVALPKPAAIGRPIIAEQAASKLENWHTARGKTLPIFALEAAELAALVPSYTSRSKPGGAREDMLMWDERPSGSAEPSFKPLVLMVAQRRSDVDRKQNGSLYLETTRRAALHGLSVVRSATPGELATKFGPFEVADMLLAAGSGETAAPLRSCLAFRQAEASYVFRLTGWLCAQPDRVIERPTLTTLIGKLTLMGAGGDRELHQIFIEADLRKDASAASHVNRKPLNWIDQTGEKPPLKGADTPRQGAS